MRRPPTCIVAVLIAAASARADDPPRTAATVAAELRPYAGPSAPGVDRSTLAGKVMCGYQGWFDAPGDGSALGWRHYDYKGRFAPGSCDIDLWPDVSDLPPGERVATPFRHADGSVAEVFSSERTATVLRHFEWMRTYGIDGVFVQRFYGDTTEPNRLHHCTAVLSSCREGANRSGRAYAVMYDLSGMPAGGGPRVIADWKRLVDGMKLTRDPADKAYLHHAGKPLVAIWGVGFNDGRKYTAADVLPVIDFLRHDPAYGGCAVMLGVPTYWRTNDHDTVKAADDPAFAAALAAADVISPWTVGRYATPAAAVTYAADRLAADLAWCKARGKTCLPVAFPGFSWHNKQPTAKTDQIPRLKGRFLWSQVAADRRAGADALYVAMFDEMDEGTAIFKVTDDPPVGASPFVGTEGLPSDQYLWLTGQAGRVVRGEAILEDAPPRR